MLKLLALIIGIANAQTTSPSYLIFNNQAQCQARSQQQCQALGCDGINTIYWWDCNTGPMSIGIVGPNAVTSGSFAMRLEATGPFSASHVGPNAVIIGLTTSEQTKLVPYTSISALVHPPNAVP